MFARLFNEFSGMCNQHLGAFFLGVFTSVNYPVTNGVGVGTFVSLEMLYLLMPFFRALMIPPFPNFPPLPTQMVFFTLGYSVGVFANIQPRLETSSALINSAHYRL